MQTVTRVLRTRQLALDKVSLENLTSASWIHGVFSVHGSISYLWAVCQLSSWPRQLAQARTPYGLTDASLSEPIIVGKLFNIQFYTQDGRYLTLFPQHFRNLYKHCQVYRTSSLASINKESISLQTFQILLFLLRHFAFVCVCGSLIVPSLRLASDHSTYQYHRTMRAFNFTLVAVLSCVAVIGATPLGASEAIGRRQLYVI